jgi:serine protease Do
MSNVRLYSLNNRLLRVVAIAAWSIAAASPARAQTDNPLLAASSSIESLVSRVSGSVVQVVVTGLRPVDSATGESAIGRGRSLGSGFAVARGGYIITNAHVVQGAEQIDVLVPDAARRASSDSARRVRASLVGIAEEWDLALLKIDLDLPALPLADYDAVRQGQLVFAFGSPDGLRNSMSMGVISAAARQLEQDSPLVYIQTDAAINPGNSGGPLVNARGEVVGIDTMIRSASGGSDGLGFALPSSLIALAYPQLREFGHLRRAVIGVATQTVTPLIAEGLHLGQARGQIVADLVPDGPAAKAGIHIGDVITAIDGHDVDDDGPGRLYLYLATLRNGQRVTLSAVRDGAAMTFSATAVELPGGDNAVSTIDSEALAVEPLAILGLPYRSEGSAGIVVAARLDMAHVSGPDLSAGDVIYSVNGTPVESVPALRQLIEAAGPQGSFVLQVSRAGRLSFMAYSRE